MHGKDRATRHNKNPLKHIWWIFFRKQFKASSSNCFHKSSILRYLCMVLNTPLSYYDNTDDNTALPSSKIQPKYKMGSINEIIWKWSCQLSINSIHLLNWSIVNKNVLLISLQTMTFCAVFERERSNFLSITKR